MFKKNKTAALLMSLLICASAAVSPVSAYADNEESATVSEAADEAADSNEKTSGDFTYTVSDNDTVTITKCSNTIVDLVIPETIDGLPVTDIGEWVFGKEANKFLETVSIPASVEYISTNNPFKVCGNLREITVASGNKEYVSEDGILFTKDKKRLVCYPTRKSGKSYAIPDGVEELGSAAIYETELEEITFPDSLNTVKDFSVARNASLKKVDLSKTEIDKIGGYAFSGCTSLTEVNFPEELSTIGGAAFFGCTALTEVELPHLITSIGQYAFIDTGLKSVKIPRTVQEIGYCAFGYETAPNGEECPVSDFIIIGEYGSAAQTYATDTDSEYGYANDFTFQSEEENADVEEILSLEQKTWEDYDYAVDGNEVYILSCNSTDDVINVPAEIEGKPVTKIYTIAFSSTYAREITIPEGVKEIKKMAFKDCGMLEKLTLPQSLVTIEDYICNGCEVLRSVDLGGAETIGSDVFLGCNSLTDITISGNCKTIGVGNEYPFAGCNALENINVVSGSGGSFSSEDGILYSSDKKALLCYPAGRTAKTFKASKDITTIGKSAFFLNPYIEEVELPNVETIDIGAFEGCSALKKVKLSKKLKTVGAYAFLDCTELKSLRFYKDLEEIGEYACGYYYMTDANLLENEENGETLIKDFKIYADKGTKGYDYAKDNDIEVITGTIELFGKNVKKSILEAAAGAVALAIAALIALLFAKRSKKKKSEKEKTEKIKKAAEKKEKKAEAKNDEEKADEDSSDGKDDTDDKQD
ncbi:MAG: leucine-rich repeat protein [Ruminococcus sp.]|nr:leucine-rich repeat protein [Ruminococcus sp.]